MRAEPWTEDSIPDQTGRVALVTGASGGIGFEAARALAACGARVLLGCRNSAKAIDAFDRIRAVAPRADLEILTLDLADLESVRKASAHVVANTRRLDLLINNAGVMAIPKQTTADGFEMQFGTNHLGHFALTGLLIDLIVGTEGSRIVNVSSTGHKLGRINFDDLNAERSYHRWTRYGMSKAANLVFTFELQRRLARHDLATIAVACHPGGARTELSRDAGALMRFFQPLADQVTQSAAMGALPTLRAAVAPDVRSGEYYGPDGFAEIAGHPTRTHSNAYTHRADVGTQLWAVSEHMTEVDYLD